MIDPPSIVQTQPLHFASLHLQVPSNEIQSVMGPGIGEVVAALQAQGRVPSGAWFTHHLRRPTDSFDFEICMPVEEPVAPSGRVQPGLWPAMKVARTVYQGSYSGLPRAWGELEAWLKSEGLQGGTEFWERYLIHPNTNPNPAEWRTELNWPLAQ